MADTINDILVSNSNWVDVYNTTLIANNKDLSICNKGTSALLYQESSTQPDDNDNNGQLIGTLSSGEFISSITDIKTKVWLKAARSGSYPVNVQEI